MGRLAYPGKINTFRAHQGRRFRHLLLQWVLMAKNSQERLKTKGPQKMKTINTLLIVSSIATSSLAQAQDTLYFAGYSGDFQKTFEAFIIPEFEKKQDVKVVYVPGSSSENLAKLQAQRLNQQINVVLMDDGPMQFAVQFGLCSAVNDSETYHDLHEIAAPSKFGGKAVGIGLVATGIAYNKETFAKNGWDAPRSWSDLTNKKFAKRVVSNPISGTYGLNTLVMFARMNGGDENNIEPGFKAIEDKLAPNILAWTSSNAQLAQMFQSNDIDVAVWGSARAISLQKTGFPVGFVYPVEGAPALIPAACVISGDNKLAEKSQALLQYLASPEVQAKFTAEGFGPVNRKTKLTGDVAKEVPYGQEKIDQLIPINWDVVNRQRADWTKQWSRTIE